MEEIRTNLSKEDTFYKLVDGEFKEVESED